MTETITARRVVAPEYGGPEVLTLVEEDLPQAGPGQVTIEVRAAGVNPTDWKGVSGGYGKDPSKLPLPVGNEVAGVIAAIGADTEIATGGGAVGDEVLASRVPGGYASAVTVPASDVFAKPAQLDFPAAANLLLVGATAADMLQVVDVREGETILVHGASGAVGVSVLQQARLIGARVIGTASEQHFDVVRRFGGEPVVYGEGLEQRVRDLAPGGRVDAGRDCIGTDEAAEVSLALAPKDRIVTIAAMPRAKEDGTKWIGGSSPTSREFRNGVRARLVGLAAEGELEVPVARTYPLDQVREALDFLKQGHPGGKLALVP